MDLKLNTCSVAFGGHYYEAILLTEHADSAEVVILDTRAAQSKDLVGTQARVPHNRIRKHPDQITALKQELRKQESKWQEAQWYKSKLIGKNQRLEKMYEDLRLENVLQRGKIKNLEEKIERLEDQKARLKMEFFLQLSEADEEKQVELRSYLHKIELLETAVDGSEKKIKMVTQDPIAMIDRFTDVTLVQNKQMEALTPDEIDSKAVKPQFNITGIGYRSKLSLSQISHIFESLGVVDKHAMRKAFHMSDTEETGLVDPAFFQHCYMQEERKRMALRFRALDLNGNGTIPLEDMKNVFRSMGMPQAHAENVQRIISTYDTNEDGIISYDEFVDLYYGIGQDRRRFSFSSDDIEHYDPESDSDLSEEIGLHLDKIQSEIEDSEYQSESEFIFNMDEVLEGLCTGKGIEGLAREAVLELCMLCFKELRDQSSLIRISAPCVVVGDIHGQYEDLLNIFKRCGDFESDPDCTYLFLGDYVDRGQKSVEVILLLFALKVKYPNRIYLLRGNHECEKINYRYGFFDECRMKYDEYTFKRIIAVFLMLPYAAIIEDDIFCVHAGFSPELDDVEKIADIQRPTRIKQGLICDLLWADPYLGNGFARNDTRNISVKYGFDVVDTTLSKLGMSTLIRAHEVCEEGFEYFADRKGITLFSAPNYCGDYGNRGAVLKVFPDFSASFVFFDP